MSAGTSNTAGMMVKVAARISTEQRIFKSTPTRIISVTANLPEANTTILGGVATGKQKAQLQAMAVGIMKVYGLTSDPTAIDAAMGIIMLDVAVLEVRQVIKLMQKVTKKTCAAKETSIFPSVSPK